MLGPMAPPLLLQLSPDDTSDVDQLLDIDPRPIFPFSCLLLVNESDDDFDSQSWFICPFVISIKLLWRLYKGCFRSMAKKLNERQYFTDQSKNRLQKTAKGQMYFLLCRLYVHP